MALEGSSEFFVFEFCLSKTPEDYFSYIILAAKIFFTLPQVSLVIAMLNTKW